MLRPEDDFELPVFDRPMADAPSKVLYEAAVRAFEEIIAAFKLREKAPRVAEDIPEFKMWQPPGRQTVGPRALSEEASHLFIIFPALVVLLRIMPARQLIQQGVRKMHRVPAKRIHHVRAHFQPSQENPCR